MRYFSLLRFPSAASFAAASSFLRVSVSSTCCCSRSLSSRSSAVATIRGHWPLRMLSNNNYIAPKGIIAQFENDDNVSAADDELEAIKQKKMAELQKAAAERQAISAIT